MKTNKVPLLDFQNITVLKGGKKVLDDICLRVFSGEHIAILGPNGAGKSSLIKTITREYYPLAQKREPVFRIWGQDRWIVADLRSTLGIVSNDLQSVFNRPLSGEEVVLSGFFSSVGLFKEKVTLKMKRKANEAIEFMELGHLKRRLLTEMSSGEARRFLIARALVHEPKALILDEPSNSLDLHGLDAFRRALRKIAQSGTGIILVTQSLADIIPEISRVILMKQGRFVADGPKDVVLTSNNISALFSVKANVKKVKGYLVTSIG